MNVRPRIFLSYSYKHPLSHNVEYVIKLLKTEITQRGWDVLDPMTDPSNTTISEKVTHALEMADAVFAEITMGIPNVMFEVGFGRGTGCPIVLIVNETAFEPHDDAWRYYLDMIKQEKSKPLPADLGDLEYLKYSADEVQVVPRRQILLRRITTYLDYLESTTLSAGACLVRRNARRLSVFVQKLTAAYADDHPMLRSLGGFQRAFIDEIEQGGHLPSNSRLDTIVIA